MTARILVVDDIPANVKLLEARLTAEYFEVISASSGQEALELAEREKIDVILLDVMMPGMDGFEVCRRLKALSATQHVPVIMVTALDQPADKVEGLNAGADDFLTKPVDDIALITRVKNLARLKTLTDEMILRATTGEQMGLDLPVDCNGGTTGGRILIVEDHRRTADRLVEALRSEHQVDVEAGPEESLFRAADGDYDLLIVSLSLRGADGLRLCSQIRSLDRTRHLPILILVEPEHTKQLLRGLEMGVNDYLVRPIDNNELVARVRTQLKRKRYSDLLRTRFEQSVEMAITDSLTGLHNRRYMESHLKTLVEEATARGRALSVLVVDIDYFKSINDSYGHDVGDDVLRDFAKRIRRRTRGIDLTCRLGGEEFVVVMPDTALSKAYVVGERLRQCIANEPFEITSDSTSQLHITASVGVAALERVGDTPATLLKRADKALYCAKRDGRNRVVADAA